MSHSSIQNATSDLDSNQESHNIKLTLNSRVELLILDSSWNKLYLFQRDGRDLTKVEHILYKSFVVTKKSLKIATSLQLTVQNLKQLAFWVLQNQTVKQECGLDDDLCGGNACGDGGGEQPWITR